MEVLYFALFFISSLIFFIVGKDDFGRTENKLISREREKVTEEVNIESDVEVKKQANLKEN